MADDKYTDFVTTPMQSDAPDPRFTPVPQEFHAGTGDDFMDYDLAKRAALISDVLRPPEQRAVDDYSAEYAIQFGRHLANIKSYPREAIERYYASEAHAATEAEKEQARRMAEEYYALQKPNLASYALNNLISAQQAEALPADIALERQHGRALDPRMGPAVDPFLAQRWMAGVVQERTKDVSWGKHLGSLALALLIPGRDTYKRGVDLRPALSKAYGEVFGVRPNTITGIAEDWHKRLASEKIQGFKKLEETVWNELGGDPLLYMEVMDAFLNPKNIKYLSIFTAADLGGLYPLAKAPRIASRLLKERVVWKNAADLGAWERAGKSLVEDLDPEMAKLTGEAGQAHRLMAVTTANPFIRKVDDAAVATTGLASAAQKAIAFKDRWIASNVDLFRDQIKAVMQPELFDIKYGALTDEEIKAFQKSRTADFADLVEIRGLSETGDKFEAVVRVTNPVFDDYSRHLTESAQLSESIKDGMKTLRETMDQYAGAIRAGDKEAKDALALEIKAQNKTIREQKARKEVVDKEVEKFTSEGTPPPPTILESRVMEATIDDVGKVELVDKTGNHVGTFGRLLASRDHNFDKLMPGAVGSFTSRSYRADRIDQGLKKLMKQAWSELGIFMNGRKAERVNKWLIAGDERKVQWGIETMRNGFGDLPRLSDAEIAGYYKVRELADATWWANNSIRRNALQFAGFKEMELAQDGERLSKIYVNPDHLTFNLRSAQIRTTRDTNNFETVKEIYDTERKAWVATDNADFVKALSEKRIGLLESKTPFVNGGKTGKWVAVKTAKNAEGKYVPSSVRELSPMVLEKRKGYIPKVWSNVNYVVSRAATETVNGVTVRTVKPIVGFETQTEAARFLKNLPEAERDQHFAQSTATIYRAGAEEAATLDEGLFLGAFGQFREDGVIKFGPGFSEPKRMTAWDSLDMYAEYLKRHADMEGFKPAMIRRFENTLRSIESKFGNRFEITQGGRWDGKINDSLKTEPWYNDIVEYQTTLKGWFAIPDKAEQIFDVAASGVGRMVEKALIGESDHRWNRGVKWLSGKAHALSEKNITQELRSLTTHYMFGFNPAQLLVQSAGMFIPFSLNPVRGIKVMPEFMVLRAAWGAENVQTVRLAHEAILGRKVGFKEWKRMEALHDAYKRSGVGDSVMQHADLGSNIMRRGRYLTGRAYRDLWQKGMFFYRMGELNTRTYAFTMAFDELVSSGAIKLTNKLTLPQIDMITKRSLDIAINMTPANAAKWQTHPLLSLPTQFLQVTAKYYENLMKGLAQAEGAKWTRSQAARSMVTHLVGFGMLGSGLIPARFANDWQANVMNWLTGTGAGGLGMNPDTDKLEMDAMQKYMFSIINGGLVETGLNAMLTGGENPSLIAFSERMAVTAGLGPSYQNFIKPWTNWAAYGEEPSLLRYLGASGSMLRNMGRGGEAVIDTLWFWAEVRDPQSITVEEYGAVAGEVAKMLASAGNNVYTSMVWQYANDIVNPRTGQPLGLVPGGEIDPAVILAKALGFTPNALIQFYDVNRQVNELGKEEMAASQTIYKELLQGTKNKSFQDDAQYRLMAAKIAWYLGPWEQYPAIQVKILENAWKQFGKDEMPYEKMMQEIMEQRILRNEPNLGGVEDLYMHQTLEKRD